MYLTDRLSYVRNAHLSVVELEVVVSLSLSYLAHPFDRVICDEKTVKCSAVGMTKVWASTSQQVLLTALMADVTLVLQDLQKSFQSANLILPDVLTVRDNALRKLSIIRNGPLPGGHEEKFVSNNSTDNTDDFSSVNDDNEGEHARRRVAHNTLQLVGVFGPLLEQKLSRRS